MDCEKQSDRILKTEQRSNVKRDKNVSMITNIEDKKSLVGKKYYSFKGFVEGRFGNESIKTNPILLEN